MGLEKLDTWNTGESYYSFWKFDLGLYGISFLSNISDFTVSQSKKKKKTHF